MKQLTCEMCGSTDLMKQDGVFVCQSCGTKYSVEEARKMMVEGTVEVAGTVNIDNSAKIENLFTMANSAYESKNFAKAEDFCNQIIALDDKNHEAWLLKGKAINYQIGVNNQRILEVYNCIMTAYRLYDKAEAGPGIVPEIEEGVKKLKELAIVKELKACMEGEVDFWVQRFENDRPSKTTFRKLKNTYIDCYNKMKAAYEEFGLETETYLKNFDNHFCEKCNTVCVSAWKTTVAYNYFREDLGNLGKNWNRNSKKQEYGTDYFRPNDDIFSTFIDETGWLISLLQYCEEQFNDLTSHSLKGHIYSNIAYFLEVPIEQKGYTAMVSTTTNGYGAVTSRRKYYTISRNLTDKSKASRRKEADKYRQLQKEANDAAVKAEAEERERKKNEYWEKNAELKTRLESENNALIKEITELNKALDKLPERVAAQKIEEEIDKLKKERDALGIFKGKEKKALQERIDALNREDSVARDALDAAVAPIKKQIEDKEKRQKEITDELTKNRD